MTTNTTPKAKTERLIVREIDGETLVCDRSRAAASCLNEFAARVWRECDGETSVAEIAAALSEDERAVWLALNQHLKSSIHLVSACEPRPSAASIAARNPRNAWSRDMTPSVRGCLARSARKPLTAWVKPPMLTRMSARCFARLRCSSRPLI